MCGARPPAMHGMEGYIADYRIYLLDGDGRIVTGSGVSCGDDQDACVQAQQMLDGTSSNQAEVWTGTRCIGRVAAVSTPTGPS